MDRELSERDLTLKDLKVNIKEAQARMEQLYDAMHTKREFFFIDWVHLRVQPYKQFSVSTRKNFKLSPKFYGPFQILQCVGLVMYKLKLPKETRINPVFHVSLLKKKAGNYIQV